MKPLIIGMGPSPEPAYRGEPWFPLAPASRGLSKLVFDKWAAFPEIEEVFELTNLNKKCHQRGEGRNKRDYVHPAEAAETMSRLTADGVFQQDRDIFLMGTDVERYVSTRAPKKRVARLIGLIHPSILCVPWKWKPPYDGSWRGNMRNALRASIDLPAMAYSDPVDEPPGLIWSHFEKESWLAYAKKYGLILAKDDWIKLIGRDVTRMSISDAESLIAEPVQSTSTEIGQHAVDAVDDMEQWHESEEKGWFYRDDD